MPRHFDFLSVDEEFCADARAAWHLLFGPTLRAAIQCAAPAAPPPVRESSRKPGMNSRAM
jgi:hypothetical protein